MQQSLSFFEPPELPLKLHLAGRLRHLASAHNIFLGASSWKYAGWLDRIYTPERYSTNGRFSRKRFEEDCLLEYAEVFPIVSGDFAFYQFPNAALWHKLFAKVPPPFQFAFKVPEEITLPVFPNHYRYGPRSGQLNPLFLSAETLQAEFLNLLNPYAERVSVLIFEFAAAAGKAFAHSSDFARALSPFFAALPRTFRYAVEIRDARLLETPYLHALRENNVAHLFNSWTDMPSVHDQMSSSDAFTSNFAVARALLRPGRKYEESVQLFSPYDQVREPNREVRQALRELLLRARRRAEPLFIFVNNRLEGFAPGTISALLED